MSTTHNEAECVRERAERAEGDSETTPLLPASPSSSYTEPVSAYLSTPPLQRDLEWSHTLPDARSPIGIIAVLFLGVFIANAEGALLLATYTNIASSFGNLQNASYLVTSYVLAVSAFQPIYGKLSDIFGRTHMLLMANAVFAVGCTICAIGQSLPQVILGRVVSGIGGAGMTSLVSILITDLVPMREVASYRSYVNLVATTGRSLGGPIGGYLSDTVGWRWSFIGQVPPTILAILLTWCLIPGEPKPSDKDREHLSNKQKLSRVDFLGAFFLTSAILAFLLPLELAGSSMTWDHPLLLVLFTIFLALGSLFLYVETKAEEPIFSLYVLGDWNTIISSTVVFCQTAAQLGMMYTVPIFFQITQNSSAALSGARLFPAVISVAIAGICGGQYTKRTGRYKNLLLLATALSSTSYLLLMLFWGRYTSFLESLYVIPGGLGNGFVQNAAFTALTAGVEREHMAMACSVNYLSGNVGQVVGLASTSSIIQAALRIELKSRLENMAGKDQFIENILSDIRYIQDLDVNVKDVVMGVYVKTFRFAHASNFAFANVAFLASLLMKEHKI